MIEDDVPLDQLRQEPYPLPKDFEWVLVDINDDQEVFHTVYMNSR